MEAGTFKSTIDAIVLLKTARFECRHTGCPSFGDCFAELLLNDAISYLEGNQMPRKERKSRVLKIVELWSTGGNRWTGGESISDWINRGLH